MAISNERANEIAMQFLQALLEKEGIKLKTIRN